MASGFSLGGICYSSVADAWDSFSARYPKDDNGHVWYINGSPTLNTSGFSFQLAYDSGAPPVANTLVLQSCQTEQIQISPDHFYVVFLVACVMFALGFSSTS